MGFSEFSRHWSATDELHELWCVKYDIIEEGYVQNGELRGIDAGHKVLQILADPLKRKLCESGEDRASRGRRTPGCLVRAGSRGLEFKRKMLEAGQRGEGSDRCLG